MHRRPRPRGYLKRLQASTTPAGAGVQRYQTIVIDPPWPYADRINAKNRGAKNHYDLMSIEELMALPLASVSAPNSHLYLWTTNSFLEAAHVLMRQWGWTQKTVRTWVKPQIGMGRYYRNNTEHVLFGVRGKQPALVHNIATAFTAPRGPHSAKPEIFYEQTEKHSPGPYLDVFARQARQGWTVLGNEVDGERIDVALRRLAA
jgi:N6-adenosine-specific RNA methylase IME4